jgi:phosphohistidine phosphatase SixA
MAISRRARGKRRPIPLGFERRRGSRIMPITGFTLVCLGLAWFFESQATTTIIFVRHTDTDLVAVDTNSRLNSLGQQRAELLADVIQDIDVVAGVDVIYASEHRRTQETAAPISERLGLDIQIRDPYLIETFMNQVLLDHKGEIVLVVTLEDALAPLVEELHGSKNIPAMTPNEYGNIYIVTIPWFGKVKTLRLRYGFYDRLEESISGSFSGTPTTR